MFVFWSFLYLLSQLPATNAVGDASYVQPDDNTPPPHAGACLKGANATVIDGPRPDYPIIIAWRDWLSAQLSADVLRIVYEEIMGGKVFMKNMAGRSTSNYGVDIGHLDDSPEYWIDVETESWRVCERDTEKYKKFVTTEQVVLDLGDIGYIGQSGLYVAPGSLTQTYSNWFVDWYQSHLLNPKVRQLFPSVKNPAEGTVTCKSKGLEVSDSGCVGTSPETWNAANPLPGGRSWMSPSGTYVPPQCEWEGVQCHEIWLMKPSWDTGIFETLIASTGMPYVMTYLGGTLSQTVIHDTKKLGGSIFYSYQPDALAVYTKAKRLAFPAFTPGCANDAQIPGKAQRHCDYPWVKLAKATSTRLKKPPAAWFYKTLEKLTLFKQDIDDLLSLANLDEYYSGNGKLDSWGAACTWVTNNLAKVRAWVPHCKGEEKFDPISMQCLAPCPVGQVRSDDLSTCIWCEDGYEGVVVGAKSVCAPCRPGWFHDKNGTNMCLTCPAGKFQSLQAQTACVACEIGTFASKAGEAKCANCSIGRSQPLTGQVACDRCASGKYNDELGKTSCLDCPATFVTRFEGAEAPSDCLCKPGQYLSEARLCVSCGKGLDCAGDEKIAGDSLPTLDLGYMVQPYVGKDVDRSDPPLPPGKLTTYLCRTEEHCPGGKIPFKWEDVCFGNRLGVACGRCPDGYYPRDEGCEVCDSGSLRIILIVLGLAPFFFLNLYKNLNSENTADDEQEEESDGTEDKADEPDPAAVVPVDDNGQPVAPPPEKKPQQKSFIVRTILQVVSVCVLFYEDTFLLVRDCFSLLLEFIQSAQVVTSIAGSDIASRIMTVQGIPLGILGQLLVFDMDMLCDLLGLRVACVIGTDFSSRYLFGMAVPLIVISYFIINFVLYKVFVQPFQKCILKKAESSSGCCKKLLTYLGKMQMKWDKVVNALGTQVTTLFIGLTSMAMAVHVFYSHPQPLDGGQAPKSVARFPEVLKGSEELDQMFLVSTAGLLLYTFGVLAWAIWVCIKAPVMAHSASFRTRYYFLIDGYRPDRWWWGTVVLIKGLLLNLVLAVFDSPKTQNVFLSVIFMVSLALLFLANPWPKMVQNVIDTSGHIACAMLLSTTSFYIRVEDSSDEQGDIAKISMIFPLLVAIMCMSLPLWQFGIRKSRSVNTYRYGQRMRDLFLLVVRRTNNEMNNFLNSLDDSELQSMNNAQDILYSKMFFLHPSASLKRDRLITEVEDYSVASDLKITLMLEQAIVEEQRDDCKSLRERAEMQWFVEQAMKGYDKYYEKGPSVTLPRLWKFLDADGSGDLTRDEFIEATCRLCPAIHPDEAGDVFSMMDLDESGEISHEEFDIIMSGMTFAGQQLDMKTPSGKLLRAGATQKELHLQRNATARLAMLLEKKRGHGLCGASETKRRAREAVARLITKRVKTIRERKMQAAQPPVPPVPPAAGQCAEPVLIDADPAAPVLPGVIPDAPAEPAPEPTNLQCSRPGSKEAWE